MKIGKSSSKNDSVYTGYSIKDERLASPEYVSLIKEEGGKFWPVITSLHVAFNPESKITIGDDTRNEFREAILS